MSNQTNKNFSDKLENRITRPTTLAAAFGGLFNMFGRHASATDLTERWAQIMGDDIASVAKLVAIKQTIDKKYSVVIRPANTALTLQLSYQKDEILRRINKYFGYDAISKITFRK